MRTVYILLTIAIILVLILLVSSFIYFEKTAHKNFYYILSIAERDRGEMEIDKYITEEHIIYKSNANVPFEIGLNRREVRLELKRDSLQLSTFKQIDSNQNLKEILYLRKDDSNLKFLSIAKSKFAYLDDIKVKENIYFFNRDLLVTFVPLIKSYNFKKGGSQSFNIINYDIKLLPPSRNTITLTSIDEEYLKVNNKKIKTERLVLKEPGAEDIFIWVDKREREIIALEKPQQLMRIKRTEERKAFVVKDYILESPSYTSQKISFPGEGIESNGIITRPKKDGIYPAIILFQGEDALDMDSFGMFMDLSDYLAKSGYVVLRFEPLYEQERLRFKSISIEDELNAIRSAVTLLGEFRFVDSEKIGIIAHADANYILPTFLKKESRLKAWVMLSPRRLDTIVDIDAENIKAILEKIVIADKHYQDNLLRSRHLTSEIIKDKTKEKKNIMGYRIYSKRMKEIIKINDFSRLKELSIPILILQGKLDLYSIKFINKIEEYIKEGGHKGHSLIYFRKLNHYFGDLIKGDLIRDHYKVNREILETITGWLDKNLKLGSGKIAEENLTK